MQYRTGFGRSLGAAAIFLSCFVGSVLSLPSAGPENTPRQADACGQIHDLYQKQGKATMDADLAHACLTTVPFNSKRAVYIAKQLRLFTQIYSAQAFHKQPPEPELRLQPVKLNDTFDEIIKKASKDDGYPNDYEFQTDIMKLYGSFHDGHVYYDPSCASEFIFYHDYPLVEVAAGGDNLPTIHIADPETGKVGEEVVEIDGEDVRKYLANLAHNLPDLAWIDGDARFNDLLMTKHPINGLNTGVFAKRSYFTERSFKMKLKSGRDIDVEWGAFIFRKPVYRNAQEYEKYICLDPDYAGIEDQFSKRDQYTEHDLEVLAQLEPRPSKEEVDKRFREYRHGEMKKRNAEEGGQLLSRAQTDWPKANLAMPNFEQTLWLIGNDTAVWGIWAFMGKKQGDTTIFQQWEDFMGKAFATLKKENIKRLIVDVTGNGGGYVALGLASIQQFFPQSQPFYGFDLRRSPAMDLLINLSADSDDSHLSLNAAKDIHGKDFKSTKEFLGPVKKYDDYFTTMGRWDIQDTIDTVGFEKNKLGQVFEVDNIILLSDGRCGSTCAIFGEAMSSLGVRSIAVNGVPDEAQGKKKMQHVGGIKGSQVWDWDTFQTQHVEKFVKDYEKYDFLPHRLPIQHATSMNLRNSYSPDNLEVPLEFRWEPANGHIYATEAMWNNRLELWKAAADQAWDGDGKPKLPESVIPKPVSEDNPNNNNNNKGGNNDGNDNFLGTGFSYYIAMMFDYEWKINF